MGLSRLVKRLFCKATELNAASARIDEQVYLLNYSDHYASVLGDYITPRRLSELYLFRAWTAQFGYRLFSSDGAASEKLLGETVNASKYVGLAIFRELHGFSVEAELGSDFISLIEDRWQKYDLVASTIAEPYRLPTIEIVAVLTRRLGIADPAVTYGLSLDFLRQLDLIKRTAMAIGVLGV